jgi:hypothetical protein
MLSDLVGEGWTLAEPPLDTDGESVVARVDGEPIKAGFLMEKVEDSDEKFHATYRSGCYDLDVKVDFISGHGQVRVERASGYSD